MILVEKYRTVAEIWRWLIGAHPDEVRAIPEVDDVNDLPEWVPPGARALVGFSMNSAAATPRRTLSAGRRMLRAKHRQYEGWTVALRERVASQVVHIRHWQVIDGDYTLAPNIEATWFIDPPYVHAGIHYVHGSRGLDYRALAAWCIARRGQVMVCEAPGAIWLPFRRFGETRGMAGKITGEAAWISAAAQLELELVGGRDVIATIMAPWPSAQPKGREFSKGARRSRCSEASLPVRGRVEPLLDP